MCIRDSIKPADKGGAVVVWKKDLYLKEGLRQLEDINNYRKIQDNPTDSYQKEVYETLKKFCEQGDLDNKAMKLVVEDPRCSRFYMLPKIHKPNIPGRPIVSACSCPTMFVSAFVDYCLQPLVKTTPAFLKDTTDFLLAIKDVAYEELSLIHISEPTRPY